MKRPLRILYVDDYALDRELVRDALEKEAGGFELVEAASRADFETALAQGNFDLVLSDFNILGFEGLQVLEAVHLKKPNLPVIIVTGTGSEEVAADAIKRGAADYVIKTPKHIQRLPHTIHAVLENKQLEDEHRRSGRALQEINELLSLFIKHSPIYAFIKEVTPTESRVLMASENYQDMVGIPGSKMAGMTMQELFPAEFAEKMTADDWAVVSGGKVLNLDEDLNGRNYATIKFPIFIGGKNLLAGYSIDITDRKHAADSIRESEEHYRNLVELSPDAILIEEDDGTLAFINQAGLRLFGATSPDQILGRNILDLLYPDFREIVKKRFETIRMEKKGLPLIEEKYIRVDGSSVDVEVAATPFVYESKLGVQVIAHNITERKRAEEEIHRRLLDLQVLYEISLKLSSQLAPPEIGRIVIEILKEHLDWHHAVVRLKQEESDRLETIGYSAPGLTDVTYPAEINRLNGLVSRVGQGMNGWVIQHGQAVRSGDLPSDPRYIETFPGVRSGLYAPMIAGEKAIGAIAIESETANAFNELDERLLITLAKITANAIHRNRLREQTEHQLQRMGALRAIDQAISASFDIHFTLEIFLRNAVTQLGADAALLLLVNPTMNTLEYAADSGFYSDTVKKIHLHLGEGGAGRVASDRRLLSIPDLRQVDRSFVHPELAVRENFVSYHAVPLIVKGQVKGVLEVFQRTLQEAGAEWLDFLETLAGQAAIAIDNNQLFESLQRSNFELAIAYDETIEGWSRALDMRDRETEGHTQRVTRITQQLGVSVGMADADLMHIRRGALLHDIGKMGVPDSILLKPGELTFEEWEIMRRHPQMAYDMLAPITFLRPAIDIPYCHHEKWDGTGYPRGLKGEQIPLAARLFAVVDVWDALRSDRPYRASWSMEKVLEYIPTQAGTHFDPQAVELFFQVMRDKAHEFE